MTQGISGWASTNVRVVIINPGTTIHAKDDLNLVFHPVGLVDMQMFWKERHPGGYCDNGVCITAVMGLWWMTAKGFVGISRLDSDSRRRRQRPARPNSIAPAGPCARYPRHARVRTHALSPITLHQLGVWAPTPRGRRRLQFYGRHRRAPSRVLPWASHVRGVVDSGARLFGCRPLRWLVASSCQVHKDGTGECVPLRTAWASRTGIIHEDGLGG